MDGFRHYLGPITEVSAFTAQMGTRGYLPPDVEDNSVAILRFANGALGVIDAKWGQVGPAPVRTSYHGTKGTLINGPQGTELYSTVEGYSAPDWEPVDLTGRSNFGRAPANLRGWRAPNRSYPMSGSGGSEQRYFVDRVLRQLPIEGAASVKIARDTQEVIEAVYKSAATGAAVRLPLA